VVVVRVAPARVAQERDPGLGELIGYLQRFEERERKMAIVRPKDRVVALLKLTRLDTLIRIFPDDEAALAYLAG